MNLERIPVWVTEICHYVHDLYRWRFKVIPQLRIFRWFLINNQCFRNITLLPAADFIQGKINTDKNYFFINLFFFKLFYSGSSRNADEAKDRLVWKTFAEAPCSLGT